MGKKPTKGQQEQNACNQIGTKSNNNNSSSNNNKKDEKEKNKTTNLLERDPGSYSLICPRLRNSPPEARTQLWTAASSSSGLACVTARGPSLLFPDTDQSLPPSLCMPLLRGVLTSSVEGTSPLQGVGGLRRLLSGKFQVPMTWIKKLSVISKRYHWFCSLPKN